MKSKKRNNHLSSKNKLVGWTIKLNLTGFTATLAFMGATQLKSHSHLYFRVAFLWFMAGIILSFTSILFEHFKKDTLVKIFLWPGILAFMIGLICLLHDFLGLAGFFPNIVPISATFPSQPVK